MNMFYRLYEKLSWIPWLAEVVDSAINGEIKNRLPLQKDNGKALSVILNGPSLNRTLHYLNRSNTDVMMVNYAVETKLYDELKPEYVCFADPRLFMPCKKNYYLQKRIADVNENTILFFPGSVKNAVLLKGKNTRKVFSVNKLLDIELYSVKLLEKNLFAPYFINIGIMALYVGIQLGYKKIYLYGADLSMFKQLTLNEKLEIEKDDIHYYGKQKINLSKVLRNSYDMPYEMKTWYETFSQFRIIAKYAKAEAVKIINMSDETMLDCFERFKE
ncbi:DUF115 domain-containing protein [Lachnospiraceae bacterium MD335]|nr:DUF115 domain-containing protein [Lachnospiraceae bacterium MD335]